MWPLLLVIGCVALVGAGILYYVCKKCKKRKRDIKQTSGFMQGIVDYNSTSFLRQPLNKQQVQPDIEALDNSLADMPSETSEKEESYIKEKTFNRKVGLLQYTLEYDFTKEELTVGIVSASELKAMDMSGFSDPYVKVYFQHEKKKKVETRVHRRTLNPVFNETFIFKLTYAEVQQKSLVLAVYDYDRMTKHDQIGYIIKPLMGIDWCNTVDETQELLSPSETKQSLGDVCFALRYNSNTGKLVVTVMEAKNLKKMDVGGLSDPYVKVELMMGERRVKKCKTSIKKCTLNPYFNESLMFEVKKEDMMKVQLVVTVIDYDRIGASEPIGRVTVGLGTTTAGIKHWTEMLEADVRTSVQWHTLQMVSQKK
ncbi:SYT2 [Bugula neritina]|uniref:SYT2 n=1 Tax=Bugula neritina TaxID=10212 RepID=A0A7J7ISA2_BUGNE|nr:SYT2 [Bugula neritina]